MSDFICEWFLKNPQLSRLDEEIEDKCPNHMIQTTFLTAYPTQPTYPLPAYGPILLRPLTSLDWKKSKNLTQVEATTTRVVGEIKKS